MMLALCREAGAYQPPLTFFPPQGAASLLHPERHLGGQLSEGDREMCVDLRDTTER